MHSLEAWRAYAKTSALSHQQALAANQHAAKHTLRSCLTAWRTAAADGVRAKQAVAKAQRQLLQKCIDGWWQESVGKHKALDMQVRVGALRLIMRMIHPQ